MSDLVVLALDIAKNRTGWAVGAPRMRRPYWGVHEIAGDWDRHEGKRLHEWRTALTQLVERHGVTYISVEAPFIDWKAFDYNGTVPILQMHGIVLELAEARRIETGSAPIASWRSHFLGTCKAPKGFEGKQRTNALKDLAMKRCADRGWYTQFHDEAEALGILDFTLSCKDPDYEHKVGPIVRRVDWKAVQADFRGESP